MESKKESKKKYDWLLIVLMSIIVGFVTFLYLYGISALNVCNDAWLAGKGDLTQHYLGWLFYRNSDWSFPIGMNNHILYPVGISIVYTDSIPLFAVFFKILSPILPDTFQYMGIFVLLCLILQAFFAVVLVKRVTDSKLLWLFISILFVFSPVMLFRAFYHTALTAHFLILIAFCLWAYKNELTFIRELLLWILLGFLCVSIQMYFVPMVGLILAARILDDLLKKQWKVILHMVGLVESVFLTAYLLGMFEEGVNGGSEGYGHYNANLNFFFDSWGYSRFFRTLESATSGQYEGLGYLGLGGLLLLLTALIFIVFHKYIGKSSKAEKSDKKRYLVYVVLVFVTVALAMGNNITWGGYQLVHIKFPGLFLQLASIFRTSGRFVWVIVYGGLIFSLYVILRNSPKRVYSLVIVAICTILQLVDIGAYFKKDVQVLEERHVVLSDEWENIADHYDRIVLVDGIDQSINAVNRLTMYEFAWYATHHGMTINNMYTSRPVTEIYREQFYNYLDELEMGNGSENNLYVFSKDYLLGRNYPNLNLYQIDNSVIGSYQTEDLMAYDDQEEPLELYLDANNSCSMDLEFGLYRIDVTGEQLDQVVFGFSQEFYATIIEQTDTKISLYIYPTTVIEDARMGLNNYGSIDSITLFKAQ